MAEFSISYNSETALEFLADKVGELEKANAILRASVLYYQEQVRLLQENHSFATVPFSENGPHMEVSHQ